MVGDEMGKKMIKKERRRAIAGSKGRFLSIFSLMTLGIFVFIGLHISGPDMRRTAELFYQEQHLADLTITSPIGLNHEDQQLIAHFPEVQDVEYGYIKDVKEAHSLRSFRLLSQPKNLSRYKIVEGRLPTAGNQIALDYRLANIYDLKDTITFDDVDKGMPTLKEKTYQIVGFVKSSEYIDQNFIGQTTVGTGSLDGYGVIQEAQFSAEGYSIARLCFKDTKGLSPYSDGYKAAMKAHQSAIENALDQRADERRQAYQRAKLAKISPALAQIAQQKALLAQLPDQTMTQALAEKEKALLLQKNQIEHFSAPIYQVGDREANPGYTIYRENSERIDVLSRIFPVFMFAVAALVALTTMTRFVEEERKYMGLLKALGYRNRDIYMKFVNYGFISSLGGTILGALIGFFILPREIFKAYATTSTISDVQLLFSWKYTLIAFGIALLCASTSALIVAVKALQEKPANLLLPKAPKAGSRIFLERIGIVWRHLSFSKKVTARNLFRYKRRMLMTILGVAGCTALLVMGFGIKDSLSGLVETQYQDILQYDLVAIKEEATLHNADDRAALERYLEKGDITGAKSVHYEVVTKDIEHVSQQISVIVPKGTSSLVPFINLREGQGAFPFTFGKPSRAALALNDEGVVVSQKLAKLLNAERGDHITLTDAQHQKHTMKVSAIAEMYMGHYVFMNEAAYQQFFGKMPTDNASLIRLAHHDEKNVQAVAAELIQMDQVAGVVQNTELKKKINALMMGLDNVILILIGCAVLLAFVVIYNLSNINVSERIRELSTIKVLGFYDQEVTSYIYRETLILSAIGILVGFFLGFLLHRFIITALPPYDSMFNMALQWSNLGLSALMTMAITLFISVIMHRKIQRVDMLEALKSLE